MPPLPVLLVVAAIVVVVVVGVTWQRGEGALRKGSGERIRPSEVALPDDAFGRGGTLLLFTSPLDTDGAAARSVLHDAAGRSPGLRVAEVDLGARGDLAGRYAVTRTPTTFVLDEAGRLRARIKGPPELETVRAALAAAAAEG
ncbi:MAG: hypothetical protein QOE37_2062 [Microbacteriaceae bacterium]|nr:hypothetical protein [Microbacteriaceae bacterium]